jgi:polysaccharide pyruvyl transferase WcaK-like protein
MTGSGPGLYENSPTGSVVVSNVFSDHNIGGAAITQTTVEMVRRALPGADLTLVAISDARDFSESHRFTLGRYPDIAIRGPLVPPARGPLSGPRTALRSFALLLRAAFGMSSSAVRLIADSRLVVSKGGHVFVERGSIKRSLSLWITSMPLVLAARLGVRSIVVCTTVGPFETWHSQAVSRFVLRRVDRVVVRDIYSHQAALDLGLEPSRVKHLPDIVFAFDAPSPDRCGEVAAAHGLADQRYGVVTVCPGASDEIFFRNLKSSLRELLSVGALDTVVVVAHAKEDVELSEEFVRYLDHPDVRCISELLPPEELMAMYGHAQCLIGRRMHSSIFALLMGTPVFAFTKRGLKVQGVLKSLGLEDLIIDYPDFDPAAFSARIQEVLAEPAALERRIRDAVARARHDLDAVPAIIAEILSDRP